MSLELFILIQLLIFASPILCILPEFYQHLTSDESKRNVGKYVTKFLRKTGLLSKVEEKFFQECRDLNKDMVTAANLVYWTTMLTTVKLIYRTTNTPPMRGGVSESDKVQCLDMITSCNKKYRELLYNTSNTVYSGGLFWTFDTRTSIVELDELLTSIIANYIRCFGEHPIKLKTIGCLEDSLLSVVEYKKVFGENPLKRD